MLRVIKIGGSVLSDPAWLAAFAAHARDADGALVVVHGGGPEISALCDRLGVPVAWSAGRRVTTPEALDVASMVLSGLLNKRVVAALVGAGVDAIGLSGEDGALLTARPREGGALGRVGELEAVRDGLLRDLLARGMTPVLSPISRGSDGALGAEELLYLTDVDGVRAGGEVVPALVANEAEALIASGEAAGGMAVKLEAALAALSAGVSCVRIGTLDMLTSPAAGTALRAGVEALA
jgi:acetylglutamate kinase